MSEKVYLAIDLKSFYASVECMERNGKDHLPGRLPLPEILRDSGKTPAL